MQKIIDVVAAIIERCGSSPAAKSNMAKASRRR